MCYDKDIKVVKYVSIGERMRILRKELKLNQSEFADKIGLKQAAIGLYENNQRGVADRTILLICEKYGVREEWLRDGTGDMFIKRSRDEEISDFVNKILSQESDSFKRRFMTMLSQLNESDWSVLERMAFQLFQNNHGSSETSESHASSGDDSILRLIAREGGEEEKRLTPEQVQSAVDEIDRLKEAADKENDNL